MRLFPRPVESAIRTLRVICDDDGSPNPLRARAAELILSAYGLADLPPDREARHNGLKGVVRARLQLSALDQELAAKVRAEKSLKRKTKDIDRFIDLCKAITQPEGTKPEGDLNART